MSASSGSQRPIKGILKNKGPSASAAAPQSRGLNQLQARKSKKWDESNIRATCRAAYRDYDLKNINEPSTPHVRIQDGVEDMARELEAKEQARGSSGHILGKLAAITDATEPNCRLGQLEGKEAHSSKLLLDKIERQRQFELRRKLHYTEGLNIKLGRELIAKELQYLEIDDEDEKPPVASEENPAAGEAVKEGPSSEELQPPASYL